MQTDSYIDGFLCAVPTNQREAYRRHADDTARIFKKHGALSVVQCWGDDVPPGKLTSMPMAVKCQPDETVVLAWLVWPSKAVRDAGMKAVMADPDSPKEMPFDGQRVIFGGFNVLMTA
ncbi:DUF1428 domain-containing protein [Ottowia testudinis]|uniref:DUF1428 domain-containing protein n=1 Tax=Ottowia testudinis TaxID=2816950 RepID=A0A975CEV6_9BURK|nr:DUF1428 domain-containing protein [Ottowia testudinis]QTD44496.1 DUF1428 domain-containing protein [Ottowia testudinis]